MFGAGENAILRSRAISGNADEAYVREEKPEIGPEFSGLSRYLSEIFVKAGYSEVYVYTFYRKLFFTAVVLGILFFLISNPLKYLLLIIIPVFFYYEIKKRTFNRIQNFEKDYTALLVSLASAIRSGLDPIVALCQSGKLFQAGTEVAISINKFRQQIERGVPEEEAIFSFAADVDHPDIDLFRSSFILARKEGSSIGECLHRLAKVTRQRQSFRRKIKAAVAMQKLSALGISGCAVIIGLIQYISNPKALQLAMNHPVGFKVLMAGVALIACGMVWMLSMARTKV